MLEKNDLAGDSLKIVPRQYLPLISREELLRKETFGSTGKCLEVYWSKEDYMRSMYSLWYYRKKYYGVTPADKRCSFDTMKGQDDQTGYERIFGIRNLTETRLVEIYREMMEYEPVWLILQPSIAELLCIVKHKHHLPWIPSLRYVEMTGEELSGSLKRQMIRSFRCLVANRYSSTEVNCIAYECPYGNLHCMEDNVRVEIIDEYGRYMKEGQCGRIYVSTMHNRVMPFEEYGIGDLGSLEKSRCQCGNHGKILHLKKGRSARWVDMRNGEPVTPYVFANAVNGVNRKFKNCICQFQVIQRDYDDFLVNLSLNEEPAHLQDEFKKGIGYDALKKARYEFVMSEHLFPELEEKNSYFCSEIKKKQRWWQLPFRRFRYRLLRV